MKRTVLLLLSLLLLLCGCAAPASGSAEEKTELIVFAAASLTEAMETIAVSYQAVDPSVSLLFNFDSSGTLKTQIIEGAPCDIFLSAGQPQMDALDGAADPADNAEGLDLIASDSRIDLLENRVVLCVPDGNPKRIQSFADLAEKLPSGDLLFAMGSGDVPVGQYTKNIFAYYGLDEAALAKNGCITYGSNVKEVTTQIREASADCGVVYATDAAIADLTVIDAADAALCGRVIYPAAVLKHAPNAAAAQAFLDYLSSDAALAVFASFGFSAAG